MRVLCAMRSDLTQEQVILVCLKPFARWVLGSMPARREDPIRIESEPVFTSREAAEWEVFCRRWQRMTGEAIEPRAYGRA